jgi:hypothetical protein
VARSLVCIRKKPGSNLVERLLFCVKIFVVCLKFSQAIAQTALYNKATQLPSPLLSFS